MYLNAVFYVDFARAIHATNLGDYGDLTVIFANR